ncbi:MAG: NADH/ubiquinone/plastoquinone (complex I) [Bacteroidetes bacterium]|nr:MAG: NADH/ubiquinone/plastoquinone (complex I) [Bacteroidota bacterium]
MGNSLLIFFIFLPFLAAFAIPLINMASQQAKMYLVAAVSLVLLFLSVVLIVQPASTQLYILGGWYPADNIPIGIHLVSDGLSRFMLLIINTVVFFCTIYAIDYMKTFTGQKYFYTLFCLQLAGLNGVVLAGDMFNLFVFMEVTAKASYALVAFGVRKTEIEASFKYQVMGGLATLFMLFGITMLYWMTSTLNMADISLVLRNREVDYGNAIRFTQLFILAGLAIKAAMIPFHAWLPDAHSSAPSPVSAMLSGVVIKVLGVYVILRLFISVFAPDLFISQVIAVLGGLSMTAGVFLAIGAWDLKRLLAYHSISQMGYVLMGIGIGMGVMAKGGAATAVVLTFTGALFHMINHAVFKGLLFLSAGSIEHAAGTVNLKNMGGLARYMPITMAASFVASMAIAGIPPFNGFFSKFAIIVAAIEGGYYFRATLGIVVGIVTLASFVKFQRYAFLGKAEPGTSIKEAPLLMKVTMLSMAVLCLAMSLFIFPQVRTIFLDPAVNTLLESTDYAIKSLQP